MTIKIPIEIVNLEDNSCHLFAGVIFNNDHKGSLVIDTGASRTVFSYSHLKDIAENIRDAENVRSTGIEANMLKSKQAVIKLFRMGDLVIEDHEILLMDLDNINTVYETMGKKEIWGLLGGDFFSDYKANIDYFKKVLKLRI